MFKKTVIAAALLSAGSAYAGTLSVNSGTAFDADPAVEVINPYSVGREWLENYTANTLPAGAGELETAAVAIAVEYKPGIALAKNASLRFKVAGGAIAANTNLKLHVVDAGSTTTPAVAGDTVADLVDFVADADGNYTEMLFSITVDTLDAADYTLALNDHEAVTPTGAGPAIDPAKVGLASDATVVFSQASIGSGNVTIAVSEARDDTAIPLAAPLAEAVTLVQVEDQYTVTTTVARDTIDVEQDRLFFEDAIGDKLTSDLDFAVTENTVDLGITSIGSKLTIRLAGNTDGGDTAQLIDAGAGTDDDTANDAATLTSLFDADGLTITDIDDFDIDITVDGTTELETRTIGYSVEVAPVDANVSEFYMVGSSTTNADAFVWDLNGSQTLFPYVPLGYKSLYNVASSFEVLNRGTQIGDITAKIIGRTDGEAKVLTSVKVGEVSGKGMVKVTGQEIIDAFVADGQLTAGDVVSAAVQFTVNAPADDITVSGYTNRGSEGRMALLSSDYAGATATSATDGIDANGDGTYDVAPVAGDSSESVKSSF